MRNSLKMSRRNSVGASSELKVCADLLDRGYDVFRAVSPQCPCDLIAHKDGRLCRVEVRTGSKLTPDTIKYAINKKYDQGRQDIFAVVLPSQIVYSPPL